MSRPVCIEVARWTMAACWCIIHPQTASNWCGYGLLSDWNPNCNTGATLSGFCWSFLSDDLLMMPFHSGKRPVTATDSEYKCSYTLGKCVYYAFSHIVGKRVWTGETHRESEAKGGNLFQDVRRRHRCPWNHFLQICFSDILITTPRPGISNKCISLLAKNPTSKCKVTFWSWVSSYNFDEWILFEWTEHSVPLLKIKCMNNIFKGCRAGLQQRHLVCFNCGYFNAYWWFKSMTSMR